MPEQTTSSTESGLRAPQQAKASHRPDPLVLLALFLLMQIMVVRVAATYRVFNATYDEPTHILAGLELYQFGTYSVNVGHPPLARLAIGLLPYVLGLRMMPPAGTGGRRLIVIEREYWKTVTLARMGTLAFLPILIFYVYRWSSLLYGKIAGLAACVLVTFSPNIMAHAGLATNDFAATATIFAAAYHLWRWSLSPSWANCLLAAVTTGAAVLSKFSALLYLPAVFVVFQLIAMLQRRKSRAPENRLSFAKGIAQAAAFCGVTLLVIWAVYSLHARPSAPWTGKTAAAVELQLAGQRPKLSRALLGISEAAPLFPRPFTAGLAALVAIVDGGRDAYLLGAISHFGWWYYFPVVLAVKSTLPMLLLIGLAAVALVLDRGRKLRGSSAYLAGGAAAILAVAMGSTFDIGARHILPIYPFLAVFASVVFARPAPPVRGRALAAALGILLLAWHAGESFLAGPDYLAYFNEIARGREQHFLGDSNLDWGQDLARLERYVEAHAIDQIHLTYFGMTTPEAVGMRNVKRLEPGERPTGWVAVSVNYLQGINLDGMPRASYQWLKDRQPYARIGKTIYLYYLPQ
ncbi:MAG TPA: glycosyltransferase family 39 protein [Bryobacterales bacterium]|nr:glycosyltransferase family 39 protein [Bryobacterales bacterium]